MLASHGTAKVNTCAAVFFTGDYATAFDYGANVIRVHSITKGSVIIANYTEQPKRTGHDCAHKVKKNYRKSNVY